LRNDAMFPKHRSETLAGTVSPLCSFGETVGGVFASRYANSTCDDDRVAKGGLKFGETVGLARRSLSRSCGPAVNFATNPTSGLGGNLILIAQI